MNRPYERRDNTLVFTTSHSYKGYESEVVMIPCVDQYITGDGQILANSLYVAMTRARSLLAIYGLTHGSTVSRRLLQTISDCVEAMNSTPSVEFSTSLQDDLNDILDTIGVEHREWLVDCWQRFEIHQEPIFAIDGSILAEPLFWFPQDGELMACFDNASYPNVQQAVFQGRQLTILKPGDTI